MADAGSALAPATEWRLHSSVHQHSHHTPASSVSSQGAVATSLVILYLVYRVYWLFHAPLWEALSQCHKLRDTPPPTRSAHLSPVWRGSDEDCTARHCADVEVMLVLVPDLWSLSTSTSSSDSGVTTTVTHSNNTRGSFSGRGAIHFRYRQMSHNHKQGRPIYKIYEYSSVKTKY